MLEEHDGLLELAALRPFLDAIRDGNDSAGVYVLRDGYVIPCAQVQDQRLQLA